MSDDISRDPFPFLVLTRDPLTLGGAAPFAPEQTLAPFVRRWYGLTALQLDLSFSFARDWVFTDPDTGDIAEWKLTQTSSSDISLTIPMVPAGLPDYQRAVMGGFSGSASPASPMTFSYYVNGAALGLAGGTTTLSWMWQIALSLMTGAGVIRTPEGLYVPSWAFLIGEAPGGGGYGDLTLPDAEYGAVNPSATSVPGTTPPLNSGGDPTDIADFTGGVPWANVGSISYDEWSFPVYGYSGTYVPADPSTDTVAAYISGSDALSVSGTITSVF